MTKCSKCKNIVDIGDYVEIDDKIVCLNCVKNGKDIKINFPKKEETHIPAGLRSIAAIVYISGIASLSLFKYGLIVFNILAIILTVSFFLLGWEIIKLSNKARITTIVLMGISVISDFYILGQNVYDFGVPFIRMILGLIIIFYLSKPNTKKLFK